MKKLLAAVPLLALSALTLSGCAEEGTVSFTDSAPKIHAMPQAVGFSESLPEGWSIDDAGVATKGSCSMRQAVNTSLHVGLDVDDTAVSHATFLNRYGSEVNPDTATLSKMVMPDALGKELEFSVYQFDRNLVTVDPKNDKEDNPDLITSKVRSFIAMRGLAQGIDPSGPDGVIPGETPRLVNPVLTVEGHCNDFAEYSPDIMQEVAASAMFVEGQTSTAEQQD